MIDQSKIDWLLNGEEVEADILNRPLRQMLVEVNTEFSANADMVESKVDKQPGKGLSDTNFTQAEKDKLSTLESSKFVGLFVSDDALPSTGSEGDYANVDGGVGSDVYRVIWDSSDNKWVRLQGVSTELTDAQIKQQYESNPDTNAFTDDEKAKLSSVATGATVNRADSENADKVHTHTTSQVTGLDAALNAKAPTSHTHPWAQITEQPATATRWPAASEVTGLGAAATRDVGESAGDVLPVGVSRLGQNPNVQQTFNLNTDGMQHGLGLYYLDPNTGVIGSSFMSESPAFVGTEYSYGDKKAYILFGNNHAESGSRLVARYEIHTTGNILTTTGQSTEYPMTQKATTDAIAAAGGLAPSSATYEYDALERVDKIVTPDGDTVIGYNPDGTVETISYPSGRVETFTYDISGNLISMTATGDLI